MLIKTKQATAQHIVKDFQIKQRTGILANWADLSLEKIKGILSNVADSITGVVSEPKSGAFQVISIEGYTLRKGLNVFLVTSERF